MRINGIFVYLAHVWPFFLLGKRDELLRNILITDVSVERPKDDINLRHCHIHFVFGVVLVTIAALSYYCTVALEVTVSVSFA